MYRTFAFTALAAFGLLCPAVVSSQENAPNPDDQYVLGEDSQRKDGVPQGKVTKHEWTSEKVYPGTWREWWLYVPAQYDGTAPAALMVFQDGHAYVDERGQVRAPVVFDKQRHPSFPDVPASAELGLDIGDLPNFRTLAVPASTPPDRVQKLHEAAAKVLASPEWKTFCADTFTCVDTLVTPEQASGAASAGSRLPMPMQYAARGASTYSA